MSMNNRIDPMGGSGVNVGVSRSARAFSIMASMTSLRELQNVRNIVSQRDTKREVQLARMMVVIIVPITTLVVISALSLAGAVSLKAATDAATDALQEFFHIDDIVTDLQVERGTTATFLSSSGTNDAAYNRLLNLRNKTDKSIAALQTWPDDGLTVVNDTLPTKEAFVIFLNDYRTKIHSETNITFELNIHFYTNIIQSFLTWGDHSVVLPEEGDLWAKLVAGSAMLRGSDASGIQRALGSTFFTLCSYTNSNEQWFVSLDGQADALYEMALSYHQTSKIAYRERYIGSELEERVNRQKGQMFSKEYGRNCTTFDDSVLFENAHFWFSTMTDYIVLIKRIREDLVSEIVDKMAEMNDKANTELTSYSLTMVVVTLLSIFLGIWYATNIYQMVQKLRNFASKLSSKTHELYREKNRTDTLLYQMLPKAVAEQLKANQGVKAEYFESVSIYFSDIAGFTSLSARSTPLQVVSLLNSLYSVFDSSIERYSVYKVETIGDAYMVVSGLPEVIDNHASEIALMSLDLMEAVSEFVIPHLPKEKLKVRIGVHTGACVAGVVGLKMPRFCLFGEAVNTASQMESTGLPQRIHVSEATREALDEIGGFRIERRHPQDKALGDAKTYWLLSHSPKPGSSSRRAKVTVTSHS